MSLSEQIKGIPITVIFVMVLLILILPSWFPEHLESMAWEHRLFFIGLLSFVIVYILTGKPPK